MRTWPRSSEMSGVSTNSTFHIPDSTFGGAAGVAAVIALFAVSARPPARAAAAPPWPVTLVDIADRAGLREPTVYGGIDQKRFIIEANGPGVAFLDVDNDGWIDALVLNGTRLKPGARIVDTFSPGQAPAPRLYRNNHDGTFSDVTAQAGLRTAGWESSVCAGDYDNDGWIDLFVTAYGGN